MTFRPNQLVVCVAPRKGGWLRKGRIYRVIDAVKIGWDDAIEVEGCHAHFFASRFRAVPSGQTATVNSLLEKAESAAATLPANPPAGHEAGG